MTKKAVERTEFRERVESVLSEAREASRRASNEYAAKAKRSADGHFTDTCGSATLWVYKPSYRLREALKQVNAIDRWLNGQWEIKADVVEDRKAQGITIREIACKAALAVFEREFPDEGKYSIHSWID